MNIWIISSFVLLTALGFFTYAIFVIFRQKRLSEIQKDFINNMTHEFKTPISTIGISANVLSEPGIVSHPERLSNYAAIIMDQNKRLEHQIEKVLQIARIERNKLRLNIEEVDVHQIIKRVAENFNMNIRDLKGRLTLNLDALNHRVKADKLHLTNIIYNLIDNGIKYSQGAPELEVSTSNQPGFLVLEVKDKGIGIEKRYHKKIFEKFFRVPTGNIHNVKGFGIGLSYVKSIVSSHKWTMKVESEPDKGARFRVIMGL
jgi:two-component system phosphate regulon sensor histidine kinase PhoR